MSCGESSDRSSSISSDLSISFKNQSVCGFKSVPDNVSVYTLGDDNSIEESVSLNATLDLSDDTVSLMVIRELDDGLDVYVAKDIDVGDLGTWYFDTDSQSGCSCVQSSVNVKVEPGNDLLNHINWPYSSSSVSSAEANYTNLPICQSVSAAESEPVLVAFARISNELTYVTLDTPTDSLSSGTISVDVENDTQATTRAITMRQRATSSGKLYYVSDDIYEFSANYNSNNGANLLSDDRVTPIRFATSETQNSGSPELKWNVSLPLSETTSTINYDEPTADEDALTALASGTQTSFDFSSDSQQNATIESFTVTDGSYTDHWTFVQGVSGSAVSDYQLPEKYSASRSSDYGTTTSNHAFSVIDVVDYDGYLYSNQAKVLREIFSQSDSDQLKSLHERGWELDFEYHTFTAED
jgi:hypothetical protein